MSEVETIKTIHEWSEEALLSKAQSYLEIMQEKSHSDWQFALWSSFSLELLLRATLSSVSITLLADSKSSNNLLYALGKEVNQKKFIPKSISISEVLNRLEGLFATITPEMVSFCLFHLNKRNAEVHSGDLPFHELDTSTWLPKFYQVCDELMKCCSKDLTDLLGKETAGEARLLIADLSDKNAISVKGLINAHQVIWNDKNEEEKEKLSQQSMVLMNRHYGHRVNCPSCKNTAVIQGSAIGATITEISEDEIIEKQNMKPSSLECIACGLKIAGYSKLMHCGLADSFIETSSVDVKEYFDINIEEEYANNYMDDNNDF